MSQVLSNMGDMNSKVSTKNESFEMYMDQQGVGEKNANGEYVLDLC